MLKTGFWCQGFHFHALIESNRAQPSLGKSLFASFLRLPHVLPKSRRRCAAKRAIWHCARENGFLILMLDAATHKRIFLFLSQRRQDCIRLRKF